MRRGLIQKAHTRDLKHAFGPGAYIYICIYIYIYIVRPFHRVRPVTVVVLCPSVRPVRPVASVPLCPSRRARPVVAVVVLCPSVPSSVSSSSLLFPSSVASSVTCYSVVWLLLLLYCCMGKCTDREKGYLCVLDCNASAHTDECVV